LNKSSIGKKEIKSSIGKKEIKSSIGKKDLGGLAGNPNKTPETSFPAILGV
jgi:hypothetical protein